MEGGCGPGCMGEQLALANDQPAAPTSNGKDKFMNMATSKTAIPKIAAPKAKKTSDRPFLETALPAPDGASDHRVAGGI